MNEPFATFRKAFDAAAIAALAVVAVSGVVLRAAQTPFARAIGLPMSPLMPLAWGLRSGTWATIHDRSSIIFIFLLLPNLAWSWGVLRWLFRRGPRTGSLSRAAVGMIALISVVLRLTSGLHLGSVTANVPPQAVPLLGDESDARLAQLSLHDIEGRLGVPADYMRINLGLPTDVDTGTPVSELMNKYHFTLQNVRGVLLMHRMNAKLQLPTASPAPRRPF